MNLNLTQLPHPAIYKLLTNLVIPRPIGWVVSRSATNILNLAPFSFFNVVGSAPPLVILGVGDESPNHPKHTAANIAATRDFVVNLVTEELLGAMNISAADFPADISEIPAAGLTTTPSTQISVPRITEAKVALECTLESYQRIGANNLVIGRILSIYIDDPLIDPTNLHIQNFYPLARLGSPSMYARTTDRLNLPRLTYRDLHP